MNSVVHSLRHGRNLLLAALISESMAAPRKRGGPNSITLMERLFIVRRYS